MIGKRSHVTTGTAGRNDHEIGKRGFALKIDEEEIFSFVVFKGLCERLGHGTDIFDGGLLCGLEPRSAGSQGFRSFWLLILTYYHDGRFTTRRNPYCLSSVRLLQLPAVTGRFARISPQRACRSRYRRPNVPELPMKSPLPALALSMTLLLPLSGCVVAAVGTAGAVGITAAQDKTMGQALDDANVSNQIKAKLLSENSEKFAEVDVEVANGLVLLSGRVNFPEDRVKAEGIAWSAALTKDVANEIKIEPPGGFIANVSDEVITGRVRARLIGSKTVKSLNFNIETYDGVVYLMGTARSAKELKKAAEEASVVSGVKQVVSYVRLLEPEVRAPEPELQGQPTSYQNVPDTSYGSDAELIGANY
jgi:osmotically-inducible protein OsmY